MNFGTKGCMYCEGECNKECLTKEELKQETLEEVVNNFKKTDVYINEIKQEQERMYSEEDLVMLLNFVSREYNISNGIGWFHTHESNEDITSKKVLDKWFEQFKKK